MASLSNYIPAGNKRIIFTTYAALFAGAIILTSGILMITDQSTISRLDNTKTNDYIKYFGWLCILAGAFVVTSPVLF